MTDFYANWKARLAGQTVKTFLQPQLEDAGYYRLPITNRKPNGQTDITGWVPVAMWVEGEELTGLVGAGDEMREMTSTQLCGEQFWSWICRNPITYEVYDAVANNGSPWPDSPAEQLANTMGGSKVEVGDRVSFKAIAGIEEAWVEKIDGDKAWLSKGGSHPWDARWMALSRIEIVRKADAPDLIPAADRGVSLNHNAPPEEDKRPAYEIAAEKIDNARGVADTFEVKDLKTAEQALGIVNRLAELRLKAKRDGEEEYKPHYNKYKALLDSWKPPIDRAEASEKALTAKINSWKRAEEKRLKDEAAKAEAERAAAAAKAELERIEREEKAARAADRAIAAGIPPAEQEAPALELEPPVEQPAPAPVAPTVVALAPTYGKRKLRDTPPAVIVEITDYDAVYQFFKNTESVKACLMILAKASIKVNVPVPGVTTRNEE